MPPLYRLAVRLYPPWWRRRYGREFEALLEEASPGWFGLFDVLIGACTMRMQTRGTVFVACGVAGALAGGIVATRSPVVFASSATLRLESPDVSTTNPHAPKDLLVSLESALGPLTRQSEQRGSWFSPATMGAERRCA